jgi:hypothetical protein
MTLLQLTFDLETIKTITNYTYYLTQTYPEVLSL